MKLSANYLDALKTKLRPFEDAELALVGSLVKSVPWLPEPDEHALRYALNLARITLLRAPDGSDVDVDLLLQPFREDVLAAITPALLGPRGLDTRAIARLVPRLKTRARAAKERLLQACQHRIPESALDREVCEKALVLTCSGGGGVSFVHLGAFSLLDQFGLTPRLLAGTSMGAILLLLRARHVRYHPEEILHALRGFSFGRLFRLLRVDSRYGLPAAMQLYLRQEAAHLFKGPDGSLPRLDQLAIPLIVAVTGIRNGALPHDPSYYENLLDLHGKKLRAAATTRMFGAALTAVGELLMQRDRFARVYLGADQETRGFDALDAVGFSSALPGVVHYDVLRDDPRMHGLLEELFRKHDLFRLVDGGLVDNLPAQIAWEVAMHGGLGTRNVFVLALDGFAPRLVQPLWYGVEQLVAQNVARNRPFIHHYKAFQGVLSPIEVLPAPQRLRRAIQNGKQELLPDMPLLARMCRPFPPLGRR